MYQIVAYQNKNIKYNNYNVCLSKKTNLYYTFDYHKWLVTDNEINLQRKIKILSKKKVYIIVYKLYLLIIMRIFNSTVGHILYFI